MISPVTVILIEQHHESMPSVRILDSAFRPPRFSRPVGASVLRGVVHDHFRRFSSPTATNWQQQLCDESRPAMSLFVDQTSVGDVLLRARVAAAVEKVLLFPRAIHDEEFSVQRRLVLFSETGHSVAGGAAESRTECRSLPLRFRVTGKRVARARAAFAGDIVGDFLA